MGNPHYVVFVTEFSPQWQAEGEEIGRHQDFKHGVNVEFVRVTGEHDIEVRFYERGVPNGVLIRLLGFIGSDVRNLVVVPPGRIGGSFLGNDPEHVRQII